MTSVGIHQQYQGSIDVTSPKATLEQYPLTIATREFTAKPIDPQNLIPKVEKLCRKVWDEGLTALWSFKPKPEDVKNGKWKPFVQQLAAWIRDQGLSDKFILIIWHEPENDIGKYFNTPEDFTGMFDQVHAWCKEANPNLTTMHAALGYRYRDRGEISDTEAPRWRTRADMHAIDLYSGRSFPLSMTFGSSSAFKRWHKYVAKGGRWSASERGFTATTVAELAQRANTLRAEAEWVATDPIGKLCDLIVLWDTVGTEGDKGLPIRDKDGMLAVTYYMSRIQETQTDPEPQPPETTPTKSECPLCSGTGKVASGQTITIVKVT